MLRMRGCAKGTKNIFAILLENNLVVRSSQQNLVKRDMGFFCHPWLHLLLTQKLEVSFNTLKVRIWTASKAALV